MKILGMRDIITLMTDFGGKDCYVAEMKGVFVDMRPQAEVIDLTHEIPSFDKEVARFQLWRSYRWFPKQTCHLVVVDPGVGGERKNLFIQTELGNFIGPDNGVLDWAVQDVVKRTQKEAAIYEIPVPEGVPPTFYGRDVFIPFLARYLAGHPQKLNRLENWKPEPFPICKKQKKTVRTQVIHVDKFGNGVLSLSPFEVENPKGEWKKKKLKVYSHYQAIPKGAVGLVSGSHGLWELAGASASAAKLLSFEKGDEVVLQMS